MANGNKRTPLRIIADMKRRMWAAALVVFPTRAAEANQSLSDRCVYSEADAMTDERYARLKEMREGHEHEE
jgi:hypothetical protein